MGDDDNQFRSVFKYYKRKQPPPSFDDVIDPHNSDHWDLFKNLEGPAYISEEEVMHTNNVNKWRIGSFKASPGLIVMKNVFSKTDQMYWASKCLKEYSSDNFKRNIDHPQLNLSVRNWYEECQEDDSLVDKLRWSTLGYHHNWDTKVYSEDNRSVFPPELAKLSSSVARMVGCPSYSAEAAIVNFYPFSASLSGHTDHSEHNLTAPLISISFGQSAVFLLGGKTVQDVPVAFLVRSGDILVMEEGARLAYHGVPKIIQSHEMFGEEENFCKKYLTKHRININIRQVH